MDKQATKGTELFSAHEVELLAKQCPAVPNVRGTIRTGELTWNAGGRGKRRIIIASYVRKMNRRLSVSERAHANSFIGASFPDDWMPSESGVAFAKKLGYSDRQVEVIAKKFRDHYRGRGTRRLDWESVWRSWMQREWKHTKPDNPSPRHP